MFNPPFHRWAANQLPSPSNCAGTIHHPLSKDGYYTEWDRPAAQSTWSATHSVLSSSPSGGPCSDRAVSGTAPAAPGCRGVAFSAPGAVACGGSPASHWLPPVPRSGPPFGNAFWERVSGSRGRSLSGGVILASAEISGLARATSGSALRALGLLEAGFGAPGAVAGRGCFPHGRG